LTTWEIVQQIVQFATNLVSGTAALVGLLVLVIRRRQIAAFLRIVTRNSLSLTIAELGTKMERLNELSAEDADQKREILNILGEVAGQLVANPSLRGSCADVTTKIGTYLRSPHRLTEPLKRSVIWQIRETTRHTDVKDFEGLMRGNE